MSPRAAAAVGPEQAHRDNVGLVLTGPPEWDKQLGKSHAPRNAHTLPAPIPNPPRAHCAPKAEEKLKSQSPISAFCWLLLPEAQSLCCRTVSKHHFRHTLRNQNLFHEEK